MDKLVFRIKLLLHYLVRGKSRYYIHSPFVYDFCCNVLGGLSNREIEEKIIRIKKHYTGNRDILKLKELGAGKQGVYEVSVKDYLHRTAITNKYGRLLYHLVRHYSIEHVVETGTALGISTSWMALANKNTQIDTIEGNQALCSASEVMFSETGINQVIIHHGLVSDKLIGLINPIRPKTLLFIDAHHTGEATLKYFEIIKPNVLYDTIIVFDDINYSADMQYAWKNIVNDQQVTLAINLYRMGVIFFNPALSKQEFYLYY